MVVKRKLHFEFIVVFFLLVLQPFLYAGHVLAADTFILELSSDAQKIVLGEESSVKIRAKLEGPGGIINENYNIQFVSNTGKIDEVQSVSSGETSALFIPSDEFFPQFALIGAIAKGKFGTARGYLILPLWGAGEVLVKTRRNASVELRVQDAVFGPVKADKRGRALVPIVVPPGVSTGIAGKRKIDLNLPPTNRIVAIASDKSVVAGSKEGVKIWVYAISQKGVLLKKPNLKLKASKGNISKDSSADLSKEALLLQYLPPKRIGNGKEIVNIFLTDEKESKSQVEISLLPETPHRIVVKTVSKSYTAGQDKPVIINVEVYDKYDNPTVADLDLKPSLGKVGSKKTIEQGRYEFHLDLPDFFEGAQKVEFRAIANTKSTNLEEREQISLRPGTPSKLKLFLETDLLYLDENPQLKVQAILSDQFNNKLPNQKLSVSATQGEVPQTVESPTGEFEFMYEPPKEKPSRTTVITAKTSQLHAKTEVEIVPRKFLFLAPYVGYFTNLSSVHSPYFSAELDIKLFRGFGVVAGGGYYFSREESSEPKIESMLNVIPVYGSLVYRLRAAKRLSFAIVAGGGVHFTTQKTVLPSAATLTKQDFTYRLHGGFGMFLKLGPGDIGLQFVYVHADSSKIEDLSGRLGGLCGFLGYRFPIF